MKKVFMSAAIIAIMAVAVSCGSNNSKKAEAAEPAKECCEKVAYNSHSMKAIIHTMTR